jgi:hypothetical protein
MDGMQWIKSRVLGGPSRLWGPESVP